MLATINKVKGLAAEVGGMKKLAALAEALGVISRLNYFHDEAIGYGITSS